MQKPSSSKEDVLQSSREASVSSFRSNVLSRLPDDRTKGCNKSEDSSSADEFATIRRAQDTKEKHIAGRKTLQSLEVLSTDDLKLKAVGKTLSQEKERIAGPEL